MRCFSASQRGWMIRGLNVPAPTIATPLSSAAATRATLLVPRRAGSSRRFVNRTLLGLPLVLRMAAHDTRHDAGPPRPGGREAARMLDCMAVRINPAPWLRRVR
jgi:hypothetical protein